MCICLSVGHHPFKPSLLSQLEAEENLCMVERETWRNGCSSEKHVAALAGTSQAAAAHAHGSRSCPSAVLSGLAVTAASALVSGLPPLRSCDLFSTW